MTTGTPFWPTQCGKAAAGLKYAPLLQDVRCDVAIIGAGITGALIAHRLSDTGARTVVLERGMIGHASTSASTSLILYELDTPLHELSKTIGSERASLVYQMGIKAIEQLGQTVTQLPADCAFEPRKSLYVAATDADRVMLELEYDARRRCGIDIEFLDRHALAARYPFERPAALLSPGSAEADPLELTRQLLAAAAARGVQIHEQSAVARWDSDPTGAILHLESGTTVRADHLIIATGYDADMHLPPDFATIQSTYAIVSNPIAALSDLWPDRCLIWETSHPYAYLRTTRDNRALIGGGDDDHIGPAAAARLPQQSAALKAKFATFFPRLEFETCSAWASAFVSTPDGLPYIGHIPKHPQVQFALCYGGNGMTFGVIAANLVRDRIMGHPDKIEEVFALDRR